MMILNKYMVDTIAVIIDKYINEEFDELEKFFAIISSMFGQYWDEHFIEGRPTVEFQAAQKIFNAPKNSFNENIPS